MASIPDLSGYVRDALAVELPAFTPRPSVIAGTPTESAQVLYQDEHLEVGIWECTPGTFPGARVGYNELMVFVQGSGTITPDGGDPVEIGPGTVYPTLDGWSSTWEVRETVRKVYVIWDDRRN
jgi:uncharacterized cupin superfamily protein